MEPLGGGQGPWLGGGMGIWLPEPVDKGRKAWVLELEGW